MMYLFSQEGRQALRDLAMRPILYAFDFDGTLAPVSSDRDAVQISTNVQSLIRALAARVPCAIVSGRALADLMDRVNGAVPHLIGNHGLESPFTPAGVLLQARQICRRWMSFATASAVELLAGGLEIEDKQYSLAFHYRNAGDVARLRTAVLDLLNQLSPVPNVFFGKLSVNVLPPCYIGKGTAIWSLTKHLRQDGVLHIGDADLDERLFERKESLLTSVHVGRHKQSLARFHLNYQREIQDVLQFMIHQFDERRKHEMPEPAILGPPVHSLCPVTASFRYW